jgi:hypothetical protein
MLHVHVAQPIIHKHQLWNKYKWECCIHMFQATMHDEMNDAHAYKMKHAICGSQTPGVTLSMRSWECYETVLKRRMGMGVWPHPARSQSVLISHHHPAEPRRSLLSLGYYITYKDIATEHRSSSFSFLLYVRPQLCRENALPLQMTGAVLSKQPWLKVVMHIRILLPLLLLCYGGVASIHCSTVHDEC